MERETVSSSNIRSVGYDAVARILEVEFAGGAIYQYDGVPSDVVDGFMKADSAGRYFAQNIRNQFSVTRVGPRGE